MDLLHIPFLLILSAVLSLWIPRLAGFWWLSFGLSLLTAILTGLIDGIALIPLFLLSSLAFTANRPIKAFLHLSPAILRGVAVIAIVILSFTFGFHLWPGFHNIQIYHNITVSPDSAPYSFFLNYDTALVGTLLLALCIPLARGPGDWNIIAKYAVVGSLVAIFTLLPLAFLTGFLNWSIKLPSWFLLWAASNLFITCISEEVVFRGIIQQRLGLFFTNKNVQYGPGIAIILTALLFGIVHYHGGILYITLSSIAGLIYGTVYYLSGRIETSIICHFLLNTSHFLLATYPIPA